MSSRVLLPDDSRPVNAVVWRRVGLDGSGLDGSGTIGSGMDGCEQAVGSTASIAQGEAQTQQRVRDAHAAGMREGEAAGRTQAAAELQPVVERLAHSIQEIANLRARLRQEAEADVVQLALAIARRVVRRELAVDPDALHGLVLAALEKLQGQEISRVKVHPSHVAMVKACLQKALNGGLVEVLSDPTREPGSVIFETTRGNLDASVDAQLQEIERGLTDRLRKPS